MGRRIEIELTSADTETWTWRAAGARQPKGDIPSSLLYENAKVGDVVKVEANFHLDGIEITEVFTPSQKKERLNIIEMKTRTLSNEELVTTKLAKKNERKSKGGDNKRGNRRDNNKRGKDDRAKPSFKESKPEKPRRPRPKRLSPKRTHRDALISETSEAHRPIIEQLIKEGLPGIRSAIKKQNDDLKAAGKPETDSAPILSIAEKNVSKARLAEWRDKADAASAISSELDLRDLRSVVVAGADVARDEESKTLLEELKQILETRIETDHAQWLADIRQALKDNRVVGALRLSSRPVRAGAPLPTDVATELSKQAAAALDPEDPQNRWSTVLDALAFSPVRTAVKPVKIPAEPSKELLADVRRLSDRIPEIAVLFGVDPAAVPKSEKRRKPVQRKPVERKPAKKAAKSSSEGDRKGPRKEASKSKKKQAPKKEPLEPGKRKQVEAEAKLAAEQEAANKPPEEEAVADNAEESNTEEAVSSEQAPAVETDAGKPDAAEPEETAKTDADMASTS